MYGFKKYFILFLIFIISFSISFAYKNFTSTITSIPDSWEYPPIIVNCYPSLNSKKRIVTAIDFWKKNGYDISFYEYKPIKEICKYDQLDGFILIKVARYKDLGESTLAYTVSKKEYGIIKSATIYMEYGTFNYKHLLEHELGHAFGLNHVKKIGHIMHPTYGYIGPSFNIE